ncbi:MAG TPA: hypothetical protein VF614_13880 [Chthoniobacteraceae bacterium]|jgi:hypothetical protein
MSAPDQADSVCEEISGELREISGWLAAGKLDPEQFRLAVLALESTKVMRFGMKLTGSQTPDGLTRFSLKFADTGEQCAMLDFNPATGELSRQQLCS